jgi:hypothetical protein
MLTQEELKKFLHYDPDTGIFTNIIRRQKLKVWDIVGSIRSDGYLEITVDYSRFLAHRLVWLYVYSSFPIEQIDHINWIKNDNRISNLREVTQKENLQNQKKRTRMDLSIPMGVVSIKYKGIPIAYVSHWYDISWKLKWSPSFNFKKLWKDNALAQAIAYREARILELNKQGAGYTNRHWLNLTF